MAGSLFDQLKNVGLIDEQKAKKAKKVKSQQSHLNKSQKSGGNKIDVVLSEAVRHAAEAAQLKVERDRRLNLERQQQLARKAAQAEIRQVIEANRLSDTVGNTVYRFVDDSVVKTLNVNADVHRRLVTGRVRIARFEGGYALIPNTAAEKVDQRDPSVLIPLASGDESIPEADRDHYAQFEVPDDLIW